LPVDCRYRSRLRELRIGAAGIEVYFEGAIFGQENMRTLAEALI
jgi:hypothetical protein